MHQAESHLKEAAKQLRRLRELTIAAEQHISLGGKGGFLSDLGNISNMAAQPKTRAAVAAITRELPLDEMLARVAEGATQTQLAELVSERRGIPTSQYYISKWISSDAERQEAWRNAKKLAADKYADQVAETIEAVKNGSMGANEAKTVMSGAQWLASRLSPAQWGDRLEVNSTTLDITSLHIEAMRNQMRTVSGKDN